MIVLRFIDIITIFHWHDCFKLNFESVKLYNNFAMKPSNK